MRIQGWESLLVAHVEAAQEQEFRWGEHDCALWCAKWVFLATGRNLFEDWTAKYSSERQLKSLMKKRGFADVAAIADAAAARKPIAFAMRGDILLHPSGVLGICTGTDGVFIVKQGVITERTSRCVTAWSVE